MNEKLQSRNKWNWRKSSINWRKKDSYGNYPDRTEISNHAGRIHNPWRERDRDRSTAHKQEELDRVADGPVSEPGLDPYDGDYRNRRCRNVEAQSGGQLPPQPAPYRYAPLDATGEGRG
jgi:hypothetical protein